MLVVVTKYCLAKGVLSFSGLTFGSFITLILDFINSLVSNSPQGHFVDPIPIPGWFLMLTRCPTWQRKLLKNNDSPLSFMFFGGLTIFGRKSSMSTRASFVVALEAADKLVRIPKTMTNSASKPAAWNMSVIRSHFLFPLIQSLTSLSLSFLAHCKYIRRNYDGTLAIHRSSTTIPCRVQLQCSIWKVLIWNSKISSKVIVGSQFRYTWSITILDCNVYNESNLTSYYQLTWDFGIKVKIFITLHKKGAAYYIPFKNFSATSSSNRSLFDTLFESPEI